MNENPDFHELAREAEDNARTAASKVVAKCWAELAQGYWSLAQGPKPDAVGVNARQRMPAWQLNH